MVAFRRVARARSASTATVAASRAAATAMRVICQPGMPPETVVWTTTGDVAGPLGSGGGGTGERGCGAACQQDSGQPGQDASETADVLNDVHGGLLRLGMSSR